MMRDAKAELLQACRTAGFADISEKDISIPAGEHGDLAIACFRLAKIAGTPPATLATQLAEKISATQYIDHATTAGPYVNIFLKRSSFAIATTQAIMAANSAYGEHQADKRERILLEYVSPNTNKPLHLGHMRNAALGWSIARLLEANGNEVIKAEIINDRGIHIMKSLLAYERWGEGKTPESEKRKPDHFIGDYYVRFATEAQKNPDLETEAQTYLKRWEEGDEQLRTLWQQMNAWAETGLSNTYERIGIGFDRIDYESDIYEAGREIILDAVQRGRVRKRADGAVVADLGDDPDQAKVLLRTDGTTVYITQDLALAKRRLLDLAPDRMLYVVAQEQDHHFRVLFQVIDLLGLADTNKLTHISYHLVTLPQGRMKSREGTVVDVDDLLDELHALAAEELSRRATDLPALELHRRAETIALAAVKYYFLRVKPSSDIKFDPQESIAFTGNTGPYLLYTYARTASIFRKADAEGASKKQSATSSEITDAEWQVIRLLANYPDHVERAAATYDPTLITDLVYELAKAVNDFYEHDSVLKAEPDVRAWRLQLLTASQIVIKNALGLLGIQTLEEM